MSAGSGEMVRSALGRYPRTARTVLVIAAALVAVFVSSSLVPSGSLHAQAARSGAEGVPHFLRFGKTYVNMAAVSHAVTDPGFGLPPGTLQVYFGGQTYVNLYGEDADACRRLLETGSTPMSGGRGTETQAASAPPATTPTPAPAPAAAPPRAATRRPPAKKAAPVTDSP